MLPSQIWTVALATTMVLEIQPCRLSPLEREFLELEEDVMEELARGITVGEVLWVCRSMDRTLYKLVALFITEGTIPLAPILVVKVLNVLINASAPSSNL